MPLRSIFFLILLLCGCFGSAFIDPFIGILTYMANYNISPAQQWWGRPIRELGIRYAQLSAISIAIGIITKHNKVFKKEILSSQEIFMIFFVIIIWLSHVWGLPPRNITVHNAEKMTKILIFLLMFSHLVYTKRQIQTIFWMLILLGLYQGYAAYTAPSWAFSHGRLNIGLGGPDFREGNFLGAHFASLLPFVGIMFLQSSWKGKIISIISAVFILNGIVLTRSRGVFLSLLVGYFVMLIFVLMLFKHHAKKILFVSILGIIALFLLTDPAYWQRMNTLETKNTEQLDLSAKGRIWAWRAAIAMVKRYPLGIGEGNFRAYVGDFNPLIPGKDTHNTYFRCLAELGILGLVLLLLLIFNAFRLLKRTWILNKRTINDEDIQYFIFAATIALVIFLTSGFFITHTYVEELYWILFYPLILWRTLLYILDVNGRRNV